MAAPFSQASADIMLDLIIGKKKEEAVETGRKFLKDDQGKRNRGRYG